MIPNSIAQNAFERGLEAGRSMDMQRVAAGDRERAEKRQGEF